MNIPQNRKKLFNTDGTPVTQEQRQAEVTKLYIALNSFTDLEESIQNRMGVALSYVVEECFYLKDYIAELNEMMRARYPQSFAPLMTFLTNRGVPPMEEILDRVKALEANLRKEFEDDLNERLELPKGTSWEEATIKLDTLRRGRAPVDGPLILDRLGELTGLITNYLSNDEREERLNKTLDSLNIFVGSPFWVRVQLMANFIDNVGKENKERENKIAELRELAKARQRSLELRSDMLSAALNLVQGANHWHVLIDTVKRTVASEENRHQFIDKQKAALKKVLGLTGKEYSWEGLIDRCHDIQRQLDEIEALLRGDFPRSISTLGLVRNLVSANRQLGQDRAEAKGEIDVLERALEKERQARKTLDLEKEALIDRIASLEELKKPKTKLKKIHPRAAGPTEVGDAINSIIEHLEAQERK